MENNKTYRMITFFKDKSKRKRIVLNMTFSVNLIVEKIKTIQLTKD